MLLDILGSTTFGAFLGGIFGYLNKREERHSLAMTMAHEIDVIKAKTDASVQIATLQMEEAFQTAKLAVEKMESEAFKDSMVSNNKWSDLIKSAIRPVILGVLMYQTWQIVSTLETLTDGLESLPNGEVLNLYKLVVLSIMGLTATAIGWYFGARSSKQFDRLLEWVKPRRYEDDEDDY